MVKWAVSWNIFDIKLDITLKCVTLVSISFLQLDNINRKHF